MPQRIKGMGPRHPPTPAVAAPKAGFRSTKKAAAKGFAASDAIPDRVLAMARRLSAVLFDDRLAELVRQAVTRLPVGKRPALSGPPAELEGLRGSPLTLADGTSAEAFVWHGHILLKTAAAQWVDLGVPPPQKVESAPLPLSSIARAHVGELVANRLADRQLWLLPCPPPVAQLPAPIATSEATADSLQWEAFLLGRHVYLLSEQSRREWWYVGALPTLQSVDSGNLEVSLKKFIRVNAEPGWVFPALASGRAGLRAFLLPDEAASRLVVAARHWPMAKPVAAQTKAFHFAPEQHAVAAVLVTEDEPYLKTLVIDRRNGDVWQLGIDMNPERLEPEEVRRVAPTAERGEWPGGQLLYQLLKDGQEIALGTALEGIDPDWSLRALAQAHG